MGSPTATSPRGRFAPSPTGELHVGNLRTALLAWLFARSAGADYLVRIEDLDEGRVREPFVAAQLADLRRIGLDWDGDPVRQSERTELYAAALSRLASDGRTYPCFCSRREIREASSAPHGDRADAYPGTCATLGEHEARARIDAGEEHAIRLRAGAVDVRAADRLSGEIAGPADDVVLVRRDGAFAYNLAVVVDDGEQRVGEVVRGDDLRASAIDQAHLCDLLGIERPRWAHVPLVLGPDGARLAKRHGAVTLAELERGGVAAEAAVSWMASSLGLAAPGERVGTDELVERFDPGRLPSDPTTFSAIAP